MIIFDNILINLINNNFFSNNCFNTNKIKKLNY